MAEVMAEAVVADSAATSSPRAKNNFFIREISNGHDRGRKAMCAELLQLRLGGYPVQQ
jgi:hypothetical protein